MADFWTSYLGRLRAKIGNDLVLMPGARAVMERADGLILLERRADFSIWGLPGGNAEEGQSLEKTMARELMEEIGIEALNLVPFGFPPTRRAKPSAIPTAIRYMPFASTFT